MIRRRPSALRGLVASIWLALFDPAGIPSAKDRRLVVFNTGEFWLAGLLDDPKSDTVLLAAQLLVEKCGSERGVPVVIARLRTYAPEKEWDSPFFADLAIPFLANDTRRADVIEGICDLLNHSGAETRIGLVERAHLFADPRVAAVLVPALDEREVANGWRVADVAAASLATMIGIEKVPDGSEPVEARDRFIDEVRAAWTTRRDRLDWEALRRDAHERLEKALH